MAHGIEKSSDMVYQGNTPWHGLGDHYPNGITIEDLRANENINFKVEKVPLFDADQLPFEDQFVIRRVDNRRHLSKGSVTGKFIPYQNEEQINWLEPFVANGAVKIDTAISLWGGAKVILTAELTAMRFAPIKDDEYATHLAVVNGHDGRTALMVLNTATRIVCNNTLMAALAEGQNRMVKIQHKAGVKEAMDYVQDVLIASQEKFAKLKDNLAYLATLPIDFRSYQNLCVNVLKIPYKDPLEAVYEDEMIAKNANLLVPNSRLLEKCDAAYEDQSKTLPAQYHNTGYHAIQGITDVLSNKKLPHRPEANFDFNLLKAEKIRQDAMKMLLKNSTYEVA